MQPRVLAICSLLVGALLVTGAAHALEVGQSVPEFTLQGSDGKVYRRADFVGTRGFVLAWFPRAFTPGCTAELGSLRDGSEAIDAFDVATFMVSTDPPEKNADFAKAEGAKHVLLSDVDGSVAEAFGVAGSGGLFAQRWTFYVDREGVIRAIDTSVDSGNAGPDIARKLGELGFPRKRD